MKKGDKKTKKKNFYLLGKGILSKKQEAECRKIFKEMGLDDEVIEILLRIS